MANSLEDSKLEKERFILNSDLYISDLGLRLAGCQQS